MAAAGWRGRTWRRSSSPRGGEVLAPSVSGPVMAFGVVGTPNTLLVGGNFANGAAQVDQGGSVLPWSPGLGGSVNAITVDEVSGGGATAYLGGDFTRALDPSGAIMPLGLVGAWQFNPDGSPSNDGGFAAWGAGNAVSAPGQIRALASSPYRVLVGGEWTPSAGTTDAFACAVPRLGETGTSGWTPPVTSPVSALAVGEASLHRSPTLGPPRASPGTTLARRSDGVSGRAAVSGPVSALWYDAEEDTLFVGGSFGTVDGVPVSRQYAFSPLDGASGGGTQPSTARRGRASRSPRSSPTATRGCRSGAASSSSRRHSSTPTSRSSPGGVGHRRRCTRAIPGPRRRAGALQG